MGGNPQMVGFPTSYLHPKMMIICSRKTHGFVGFYHHFRKPPNMKNRGPKRLVRVSTVVEPTIPVEEITGLQ